MNLRLVLPGLCVLLVAASCHATTLKLSPDIDLLVLDGHKISGSLLKGADGLELEKGEHQFLFRVEKMFSPEKPSGIAKRYISEPLIATFTAQAKTVSIHLPPLTTLRDGHRFNKSADFRLLDEDGKEIFSKRDKLALASHNADLEKAMLAYNQAGKAAAVPRFAHLSRVDAVQTTELPADLAINGSPTGRLLELWFHQVDSATRQRLISWVKALRAS